MRDLTISVGASASTKNWCPVTLSYDGLKDRLKNVVRTPESTQAYHAADKQKRQAAKDHGGFVGGRVNGQRSAANVEFRSLITLDGDKISTALLADFSKILTHAACLYTTHSHTPKSPRARIVMPLTRDVTADEYQAVARYAAESLGINCFDPSCFRANQLMYWPSASADGQFIFSECAKSWLDPDEILNAHPDWRDVSTLPHTDEETHLHDGAAKAGDPFDKPYPIGEFCRAHSIRSLLENELSDLYEPTDDPNRWHFKEAGSIAGALIYDEKWLYSHHAKDRAYGQLLNAFDLMRVQKFGSMDEGCGKIPLDKRPSHQAMLRYAQKDPATQKQKVQIDFKDLPVPVNNDWLAELRPSLKTNKDGEIRNTPHNLLQLIEHSPDLKAIFWNEFSDQLDVRGDLPWRKYEPHKGWRDTDWDSLDAYLTEHCKVDKPQKADAALRHIASSSRVRHPVKEYLNSLPKWDGRTRAELLLIRTLGAEDNAYTRAVTRKFLIAAVKRIFEPGCKFDCILVLIGPQGIGKSMLLSRLGGEWFSDSLSVSDMKDKTAAEKLQNAWILELPELAGLRKADSETVKSFISSRDDIYRRAYGRGTEHHPRQCVLAGTTNADEGFLRDTTGNRRFWPVVCAGGTEETPFSLTDKILKQVWAEALEKYRTGELLILEGEMTQEAIRVQNEQMETDERLGLVEDFLHRLLPEDWPNRDIANRGIWLYDSPNGGDGKISRQCVCIREIWCEALRKDLTDCNDMESRKIGAMLRKLGWEKIPRPRHLKIYGNQKVFTPPKGWVFENPETVKQKRDPQFSPVTDLTEFKSVAKSVAQTVGELTK